MKAIWNGTVLAESDDIVTVERNAYFPKASLKAEFFQPSDQTSHCPWKGDANYLSIEVNGEQNPNAAWTYPNPKEAAAEIKDRVAFWRGVEIVD